MRVDMSEEKYEIPEGGKSLNGVLKEKCEESQTYEPVDIVAIFMYNEKYPTVLYDRNSPEFLRQT